MAPITAWTMALLCSRLIATGIPAVNAAAVSLACGLATPILFRAAHLNHNLLVADAGFAALLLVWDPNGRGLSVRNAALAGLLAGYTVLCDFSGLVVVATAALYVWLRGAEQPGIARWRVLAAYGLGVLPGVAGLMLYQAWAFGSFYRPSQHYMAPTAPTARGYRGFDYPSISLIWANFFDPRSRPFRLLPGVAAGVCGAVCQTSPLPDAAKRDVDSAGVLCALRSVLRLQSVFVAAAPHRISLPRTGGAGAGAAGGASGTGISHGMFRRLIIFAAGAQSLVMAAAHENNLPDSAAILWRRRGSLLWMIRLDQAGIDIPGVLRLAMWVGVTVFSVWICRRRQERPTDETTFANSGR